MAWDSTRPVPWNRLLREWAISVVVLGVAFALLFRDRPFDGIVAGLIASGPLYLLMGWTMAKLGYRRKTLKEARAESIAARAGRTDGSAAAPTAPRPRPAPTRRTGGAARPGGTRKR